MSTTTLMQQTRFDGATPIAVPVPTTRETRRASWQRLEGLADRQRTVLAVISEHGPICDRRIGELLRWPVNRVTGRRSELLAAGLIQQAGTVQDAETRRTVATWQVVR